jgi:Membrane domain of glycerophosphoryl diester phosphodiesterase/GYF domain 2
MANYKVIGGDLKQYGPVSTEDLCKWIVEGRLNAQSLVQAYGDIEWKKLSQFPEFADALAAHPAATSTPSLIQSPANWLELDYQLDIGGCIGRSWNLCKENFGLLFIVSLIALAAFYGFTFMLGLVTAPLTKALMQAPVAFQVGFKYLLPLVTSLVAGPIMGGLYFTYLKVIRQQSAGAADVFAGFQKAFVQLYLGALVVGLIVGACLLPFQYFFQLKAGPVLEQLQQAQAHQVTPADPLNMIHDLLHAYASTLPILLICLIPMTYLTVCLGFTLPLVIDKQTDFWSAMKASWKRVNKHWWQVFGVVVLAGLINIGGLLLCCVGILFTFPISLGALMYAYETVCSPAEPQNG